MHIRLHRYLKKDKYSFFRHALVFLMAEEDKDTIDVILSHYNKYLKLGWKKSSIALLTKLLKCSDGDYNFVATERLSLDFGHMNEELIKYVTSIVFNDVKRINKYESKLGQDQIEELYQHIKEEKYG